MLECCQVREDTDLNPSDHLPLSVTLSCSVPTQFAKDSNWITVDWATQGPYLISRRKNLTELICTSTDPMATSSILTDWACCMHG